MIPSIRKCLIPVILFTFGWFLLVGVACDEKNKRESSEADEAVSAKSAKSGGESPGSKTPSSAGVLPGDEKAGEKQPEDVGPKAPALFFMAGLKGYLEPCGCTADVLLGGAERIAGYAKAARKLYPATLMLDAGDTFFEESEIAKHSVPQAKARAEVIAELQKSLRTKFMVPGERDFALGGKFYRRRVEKTHAQLLAANLEIGGEKLRGSIMRELQNWKVGLIGAVDPELFAEVEGAEATKLSPALKRELEHLADVRVDAVVVLLHGGLKRAKEILDAHEAVDFVVVGHDPRETDQVDKVGHGYTLEAYDQGRYFGVLKLFGRQNDRPYRDARTGSKAELEKIANQIDHVNKSIDRLPPSPRGEEPPILKRLRERLRDLKDRRQEIKNSGIEVSETNKSFLFRPVAMEPGFPIDESIRKKRNAFNRKLEKLSRQVERAVPPVEKGEATYIGTNQCATCHKEAHDFWQGTRHATALETLQERNKAWDQNCVGCHVVGYEKPGGSVLGKLKYEEEIDGSKMTKDLRDVGCENCHGPGSKHRAQPVDSNGDPQHIRAGSGRDVCMQCHVQEHSPRFNYGTYVEKITGEGHRLRSSSE